MSNSKKTVLAFDTAMAGISVGINAANGYTVSRQVETQRGQASMLIPLIQEMLEEAQIEFKDLDLIVSTFGPGSFTGLRIGLTTAKTLSMALNIPLVGLNTLDVMARHYETDKPLLIVLETKRKDFYAKFYNGIIDTVRTDLSDPFSGEASEIMARVPEAALTGFDIGGDCINRFKSEVSVDINALDNWVQPDAILMAQMGLQKFEALGADEDIQPLYMRGADVSMSKKPQRKLASE